MSKFFCDHCERTYEDNMSYLLAEEAIGYKFLHWCIECVEENMDALRTYHILIRPRYNNNKRWSWCGSDNKDRLKQIPKKINRFRIRRLKCLKSM